MKQLKYFTLALSLGLGFITQAQASTVSLAADGQWNEFNVDDFSSASQGVEWIDMNDSNSPNFGSALTYQFTVSSGFKALLSVVDAGSAGDRFEVFNNGQSIGLTSTTTKSTDLSNNFDSNLTNANFSNAFFTLSEGTYNITGALFSTFQTFNSTNGAVKLEVTAVPLPDTFALFFGSLSLLTFFARRRHRT